MLRLQDLLAPTDVLLISDEVYEHMVFDGQEHQSAARFPGLASRAFIVSSFGKTYHVTGWKVGYVAAPASLTGRVPQGPPVQCVHRQHAGAAWPGQLHGRPATAPAAAGLLPAQARPVPRRPEGHQVPAAASEGTYFQCVDISGLAVPERDLPEGRILQMAHHRGRRGRHPAVGLLRRRFRPARGALLLRQEGRDAEMALERLARL
jgi:methionine aminotransferase